LGFFRKLFGPKAIVIESPVLGVLDLTSGNSKTEIDTDSASFFQLFETIVQSSAKTPLCDLLMLYANFSDSGSIEGTELSMREIIRDSSAAVVVIGTENDANSYIAAASNQECGLANLVLTIDRKGKTFGSFYTKLFAAMLAGETMPVAWNDLAPQIPGHVHEDVPDTIFSCERGQIAFAYA